METILINALIKYLTSNPQLIEGLVERLLPKLTDWVVAEIEAKIAARTTAVKAA